MIKKTFYIFGKPFTVSIGGIKHLGRQLVHSGIHFVLALISPAFSLGAAIALETRDGEQGHLEKWKEGFNIFPDFVFRIAGVVTGYFVRNFIIGVLYD